MMGTETHPTESQLALVVGGGPAVLEAVEPMLRGSRWSIEFVEMGDEPYGTVVAMRPDLVVVSLGLDQPAGFELLSMLRLDPRTRGIPVLSYVRDEEAENANDLRVENSSLLPLDALMATRAPRH
jgi:CheY-like chemotaxis protein